MKQQKSLLSRDDRKTSQGFVDIKSKTIEQLEELIERQDKLLQNRHFVAKLPDKGEKLALFKAELELEFKKRQEEYHSTCQLFSNLTLNDENLEEIEWKVEKSNKSSDQISNSSSIVDSENESELDPLSLLASHSGTASGKRTKINCNIPNEAEQKTLQKALYVEKFCEKYGTTTKPKERFKPNQLNNNDKNLFASSAKKVKQRLGDKWEVTQATPPVPIYKDTVIISLSESLKLQKEQAERLKEIEKKYATERLIKNFTLKMGDKLPLNGLTEYRTTKNVFDESIGEGEEYEVNDSEEDKEVTVCYSLENYDAEQ